MIPFAYADNDLVCGVLNAMPVGIVVIDSTGIIVFVNNEIVRLFQFSQDELPGQAAEILVPLSFRERHLQMRNSCVADADIRRAVVERGGRVDRMQFWQYRPAD